MPTGDKHTILAWWSHGVDVLRCIGVGQNSNGSAVGSIENTICTTGGAGAGTPGRKRLENFSRCVVEFHAIFGLLRSCCPYSIVTQYQLQITGGMRPRQLAVFGRGDHHPCPLGTSEE